MDGVRRLLERWRTVRDGGGHRLLAAAALLLALLALPATACEFRPATVLQTFPEQRVHTGSRLHLPPRTQVQRSEFEFELPATDQSCWLVVERRSLHALLVQVEGAEPVEFSFYRPGPADRFSAAGFVLALPVHAQGIRVRLVVEQVNAFNASVRRVDQAGLLYLERLQTRVHSLSVLIPMGTVLLVGTIWLRLRDPALAAYGCFVACLMLVTAELDGELFRWPLVRQLAQLDQLAGVFLLCFFGLAIVAFYRYFLAPLDRQGSFIANGLSAAFLATAALIALAPAALLPLLPHLVVALLLLTVPLLLGLGVRSFRSGHSSAPYFLVGWSVPLLTIPLRVLAEYGVVEGGDWIRYAPRIAFLFETLVFGIGLADRAMRLRIELDRTEQLRQRTERALDDYRQWAETDALTGVASRRALDNALAEWADRRQRGALLFIDIDHFKTFNDRHGHGEGDVVLKAVARRIEAMLPFKAFLARYGGEEFIALLPGIGEQEAAIEAERIRAGIESELRAPDGSPLTVSIGLAVSAIDETIEQTLRRADAALYRAKAGGRNRVESRAKVSDISGEAGGAASIPR